MSIELESAARLAALRDKANAATGETADTLAEAVAALIAGYGQGGGEADIPDWDDDSPVIASGTGQTNNCTWTLTERGTMRWKLGNSARPETVDYWAGWNSSALSVIPVDYLAIAPMVKQVDIQHGFWRAEVPYAVNCRRVRLPSTINALPVVVGSGLTTIDIGQFGFTALSDYWSSGNRMLETVVLPETITTIPNRAFADCYSLKSINLDHITIFGNDCFRESFSLSGVIEFSPDLVSIGSTAFYRVLIETLKFRQGPALPSIANNSFAQCRALKDIYVPWAEGVVANAPWGTNATIHYNTVYDDNGNPIV